MKKFWNSTKRFFSEVNKKLVERSPISSIPPFNKVKDPAHPNVPGYEDRKENPPL